jgi:hypothetical protein
MVRACSHCLKNAGAKSKLKPNAVTECRRLGSFEGREREKKRKKEKQRGRGEREERDEGGRRGGEKVFPMSHQAQ